MPAIVKAINQVFIVVDSSSLGWEGCECQAVNGRAGSDTGRADKVPLPLPAARAESQAIITQARQRQCALD